MSDEFREQFKLARARHKAGDFAGAEVACLDALAVSPDDAGAIRLLAGILGAQGRHHDAEATLLRLSVLQADDAGVWVELGHARRLQSRLDDAAAAYRQALVIRPNLAAAHAGLGQVHRRTGDRVAALAAYRAAWTADPERAQWPFEAAREWQALGRPQDAEEACAAALAISADHVPALRLRATQHQAAQRFGEALACCEAVLRQQPRDATAHVDVANAHRDLGHTTEAATHFLSALTLDQRCLPALIGLGWLHRERGDHAEAAQAFERAAILQPDNAKLHLEVARELRRVGRRDDATTWCQKALALDPDLAAARRLLDRLGTPVSEAPQQSPDLPAMDHVSEEPPLSEERQAPDPPPTTVAPATPAGPLTPSEPLSAVQMLNLAPFQPVEIPEAFDQHQDVGEALKQAERLPANAAMVQMARILRANPNAGAVARAFMTALRRAGRLDRTVSDTPSGIPRQILHFGGQTAVDQLATWRDSNPAWVLQSLDDDSAFALLAESHPSAVLEAYMVSAHPQQKAALVLLAVLATRGGVYVGGDLHGSASLDEALPSGTDFVGYQASDGTIGADLIAAVPDHPVVRRALNLCVEALLTSEDAEPEPSMVADALTRAFALELAEQWPAHAMLERLTLMDRDAL